MSDIMDIEGIQILDNSIDGLSLLYKGFRNKFLHRISQDPIRIRTNKLETLLMTLEKAILITLAIEYQKDEAKSFTTTEIAHLVNKYFKKFERSKNNVSRYFNQAYYVYYEVKYENHKNRYKISPIGYSEAMVVLRNLIISGSIGKDGRNNGGK